MSEREILQSHYSPLKILMLIVTVHGLSLVFNFFYTEFFYSEFITKQSSLKNLFLESLQYSDPYFLSDF